MQSKHQTRFPFLLIVVVYLLYSAATFTTVPPVWPDEAIYANIAKTWQTQNRLTTTLWEGMIPGIDMIAAWNPPLYFWLTSIATSLFANPLIGQRLLSVVSGLVVCIVVYFLLKLILRPSRRWLALLGPVILITDYSFMAAARIARPEIIILAFTLVMMLILVRAQKQEIIKKPFILSLVGFGFGIPSLIHPIGIAAIGIGGIYIVLATSENKARFRQILLYLSAAISPLIIWIMFMYPYWPIIKAQYQLALERKLLDPYWIQYVLTNNNMWTNAISLLAQIAGLITLGYITIKHKSAHSITLLLNAFLMFIVVVWGRMFWYLSLFTPFYYLLLVYHLQYMKSHKVLILSLMTVTLTTNILLTQKQISIYAAPPNAYGEYCQQITKQIPEQSTVLLFAIPDPYYCFTNRQNKLIEFPVLPMKKTVYQEVLHQTDYVVTQQLSDDILFGDLLERYINANGIKKQIVTDTKNFYGVYLFTLSPRSSRTDIE